MGLLDGIGSALDSGAVDAAVEVGSTAGDWIGNVGGAVSHAYGAASSDGNWWDTALDWGTKAFDWMEKHPEATKVLGGVVGGAGSYLGQRELQRREAELLREQWERERQSQMIAPARVSQYGSHTSKFGNGLLTGGPIAGYRGLQERQEG